MPVKKANNTCERWTSARYTVRVRRSQRAWERGARHTIDLEEFCAGKMYPDPGDNCFCRSARDLIHVGNRVTGAIVVNFVAKIHAQLHLRGLRGVEDGVASAARRTHSKRHVERLTALWQHE